MTTIIAKNQTGSAISLTQLSVPDGVLPASPSSVTLTDWNSFAEIINDPQLLTLVQGDSVILNNGTADLTKAESIELLTNATVFDLSDLNETTTNIQNSLDGYTPNDVANQRWADSTQQRQDLRNAADGYALDSDLDAHVGDTNNPHSVTKSQVGLGNVDNVQQIPLTEKGAVNGVATLDAGGKIPSGQIPAVALPEVYVVADATARLALTVQEGDEAIQTDDGSHWIYDGSTWQKRPRTLPDNVTGPGSATDSAIALFDGTTGKVIKNSNVTIDGSGNVSTTGTVDGVDVSDLDGQVTGIQNTLDGYALKAVEDQRWVDSTQQRQDIRDALDGYALQSDFDDLCWQAR